MNAEKTRSKLVRKCVCGALLLLTVLFLALSSRSPNNITGAVKGHPPLSNPSKYGLLTSSRWCYGAKYERTDLKPVSNPNPYPEPQPHRDHPYGLALSLDGRKAYIALPGSENDPGNQVAVFDVSQRRVTKKIKVGSFPTAVAMHPGGRLLIVLNRFSNYASVIDTTKDEVVSEIPLDYYCMFLKFNRAGTIAYVSNRYLNQVFVLDVNAKAETANMRLLGGFDETAFLNKSAGKENLAQIFKASCGTTSCHQRDRGGFYAGNNALKCYFSAIENSIPGEPSESILLRAVTSVDEGGFADNRAGSNFHAGGRVVWKKSDNPYQQVASWIGSARYGPGIPVENFSSKPGPLALSADEKYLYVGNQGSPSISIVDTNKLEEVSGIYTQNIITDLGTYRDSKGRELLIATSLGLGFGAPKERDPAGGETTNPSNKAAQFTVLRDVKTTEPLPVSQQQLLGPFDAVDGTAAFKMGDIQNDVIVIDTGRLKIPPPTSSGHLQYALKTDRYQAHDGWVRYTSDSAEALAQDMKGDIAPELQRVVGAFPEGMALASDRAYVAMLGSYQLVEWKINAQANDPAQLMEPVTVYDTGIMPRRVQVGSSGTPAAGLIFVSNYLGETLSIIDTKARTVKEYPVGDLKRPFPDTNAERGEMFVNTCIFSGDQDTACMSCHIYGTSDSRGWGAGQTIAQTREGNLESGGLLAIPQLRNLFPTQPFYFEGTHTAFDAQLDDAREHVPLQAFLRKNPQGDFGDVHDPRPAAQRPAEHEEVQDKMTLKLWGDKYFDLQERRDESIRRLTMKYFGKAFNFRDFQRFIGEYQAAESRLQPNPYNQNNVSVMRGKLLFNDLAVGCVTCHKPPNFTDKSEALYHNRERVLPSLISFTPRERSFTLVSPSWMDTANGYKRDVEPWEQGRVKRNQGFLTTFQLRGLFDRPPAFLHHAKALSVRETFAAPNHYSLRKFKYLPLRGEEEVRPDGRERGFNELSFLKEKTYMVDTHGATSHLSARQVQDLENFLVSIE